MAGAAKRLFRREREIAGDRLRAFLRRPPTVRVALFAQGRSGSTALASLLNCHPEMYFDREILSQLQFRRFLFPYARIQARSTIATAHGKSAYGFHVKINQLVRHQRVSDPKRFLERLLTDSWKLVYLYRRNYVRQAVSNVVARARGQHTARNGTPMPAVVVAVADVLERVQLKRDFLEQEASILEGLPHLKLCYESDLLNPEQHQQTADRVFDWIGLDRCEVQAGTHRTSTSDLSHTVTNYEELEAALATAGVGGLLAQP